MTLNHRVPGSSPGAPTKLFKHLAIKRKISLVQWADGVNTGVTLSLVNFSSVRDRISFAVFDAINPTFAAEFGHEI
jgi:hypothetical protein